MILIYIFFLPQFFYGKDICPTPLMLLLAVSRGQVDASVKTVNNFRSDDKSCSSKKKNWIPLALVLLFASHGVLLPVNCQVVPVY